jgi:hypothetical protein
MPIATDFSISATGSPAYQEWRTTATLTASGGAVTAIQQLDE